MVFLRKISHCIPVSHAYVKNFVEVSLPTKITNILPHENYPLYGSGSKIVHSRISEIDKLPLRLSL